MNQPQELPDLYCAKHKELIKHICLASDCNSRYMCRQCQKTHPYLHLIEFEDLQEILTGRLADDLHKRLQAVNQQTEDQERISQNDSHELITSIEDSFHLIQNHITEKLNETRELIITGIKSKFNVNTTLKQEVLDHSDHLSENFKIAQANNFSNAQEINNLINSLCNAQTLRNTIDNLKTSQKGDLAKSHSIMTGLINDFRTSFAKLCSDLTDSFQTNKNPSMSLENISIEPFVSTSELPLIQAKNASPLFPNEPQPRNTLPRPFIAPVYFNKSGRNQDFYYSEYNYMPQNPGLIEELEGIKLKALNTPLAMEYVSKNREWAFGGGGEGIIEIWNANNLLHKQIIRAHNSQILMLKYVKEKNVLLSCTTDGEIGIWDTEERYSCWGFFTKHGRQPVYCIEYVPEFEEVVSAGEDGILRFWSIEGVQEKGTIKIPNAQIHSLCYLHGSQFLLASTEKGIIHVVSFSFDEKGVLRVLTLKQTRAHYSIISKMQFLADRGVVVTGSYDGLVKVWDLRKGGALELSKKLGKPGSQVMSFIVVENRGWIISNHDDRHIRVWEEDKMLEDKEDESFGRCILYSHHAAEILTGTGKSKMIKRWKL